MTATDQKVDAAVRAALEEVAPDADVENIDAARNLRDQVELDSVDFLNFVMALERRLDMRIPEVDYPKLSSLDGCRRYLAS